MESIKPAILIYKNNCSDSFLKEVIAGIEEEGVPYLVEDNLNIKDPKVLAFDAANSSQLGAGIGIYKDYICVQCRNLNIETPLFEFRGYEKNVVRNIGSNGARYVKGIAFKII